MVIVDVGPDNSPEFSDARKQAAALIAAYIGVSSLPEDPKERGRFVSEMLTEAISGKSTADVGRLIASLSFIGGILARRAARPVDWDAYEDGEGEEPMEVLRWVFESIEEEIEASAGPEEGPA